MNSIKTFVALAALLLSVNAGAQVELLPKYPTQAERSYMEAKAAALNSKTKPQRPGSTEDAKAGPDSCEDICGTQAPSGCWCDDQCQGFGDCCDDYEEFCLNQNFTPTPLDLVVPGEFEESQAVLLRWTGNNSSNSFKKLYAELIDAIQQSATVWIMISNGSDSTGVINNLATYGVTLTNHEFLIVPTNSIWTRDYGPWGFYYTDQDSLAMVDMQYYSSRPLDNAVPAFIAGYMGLDHYTSEIRHEGGNLMVDGFGHAFHTTSLFQNNANFLGWSTEFTRQTHEELFRTTNVTEPTRLNCDGGTGHIDMWSKLIDEETMIVTEYPSVVTASDKTLIEDNVALYEGETSVYGSPFNIIRLPMPLADNGSFYTTCNQIDNDARGFVNGLFVNETLIIPIYSNENSPAANQAYDEAALDLIREALPGYNVVGIDARALTPLGGAIHCIAMQIPADNPVRFFHPKVAGLQSARSNYHILAEISNRSGIANASCFWKVKGELSWNEIDLADSAGFYVGNIPNPGFTVSDTIVYYLDATTNNGKNATKPIVAPEGFYSFFFDENFTGGTDCSVPAGLFTSNITNNSARLNWTPVPSATSYTISGGILGGGTTTIEVAAPADFRQVNNILQPGSTYEWKIKANCGVESSVFSPAVQFTTNCGAPQNLSTSNITNNSATFEWDAVPGAFGYQIRGGIVGGGTATVNLGSAATSFNTPSSLQSGANYQWKVRAFCNSTYSQVSPWSVDAFFTTAVGMAANEVMDIEAKVFPNPNTGSFRLVVENANAGAQVILYDLMGRVIISTMLEGVQESLGVMEFSGISEGVYLLKVEEDNKSEVVKVFVR
ncbi:MAG TPA: agmatine deiminase family protein [Cryomorphaceae bacterium]|nr:agmatine deiminase family protein [Cryomorphaceae bacterium]